MFDVLGVWRSRPRGLFRNLHKQLLSEGELLLFGSNKLLEMMYAQWIC